MMTKYMLIETSLLSRKDDVYERFIRCGRMLPDGLIYIYSWLEKKRRKVLSAHGDRRLQLVRGMDRALE
jgi:hypothetical protein